MGSEILAINSTPYEGAMADAMDASAALDAPIGAIRMAKLVSPPPSFLPFLIYEYGLGELTPYVPNLYELIREGIDWQRMRGTPAAIDLALGWIGYAADLEEADTARRFWNLFQLELDHVRDDETDLARIEGVARLSSPARSVFWRGYAGYDVRPLTPSESALSECHLGAYSGARIVEDGALWSFGRDHEFDHTLTEAELTALDAWLPEVGTDLTWGDFTWDELGASWADDGAAARSATIIEALDDRPVWAAFFDSTGDVIGYRKARAVHPVRPDIDGAYRFGADRYAVSSPEALLYVEILTGFGDGFGSEAAEVALIFDAVPADPERPGLAWAGPEPLSGGLAPVCRLPVSITFGRTVRERLRFLLRI